MVRRLCEFQNALGTPKQGFHAIRLFNVAILDVLGTLGIAGVITWKSSFLNTWPTWGRFSVISVILLVLGEFFHWLFCVPTTVMKILTPPRAGMNHETG